MDSTRSGGKSPVPSWLQASALVLLGLTGSFWPEDAEAQLYTRVGSFVAPTTGNPTQNVVVQFGFQPIFQPKAVIFFWTAQTAQGLASNASAGFGFATAAGSERAVSFVSDHNLADNNPRRWQWTNRCISVTNTAATGGVNAFGTLVSMDSGGFTISWTRGSAWIVHWMALGGPDITNAAVGSFTPTAGPGTQDVVAGFQPDFLMFLSIDSITVGSAVTPDGKVSLGYAGVSNTYGVTQGANTAVSRDSDATQNIITNGMQRTDVALLEKDTGSGAGSVTLEAAVVNPLIANGFTINKVISAAPLTPVHYLALRGGQYRLGWFWRPHAAGPSTQAYTGVGFVPQGLLFQSYNLVEQTVPDEEARISFSVADRLFSGTPFRPGQRATFFHDKIDAPADSDSSFVSQGTSGSQNVGGRVLFLAQAGDCPPRWAPEPGGAPPASPDSIQCGAGPRLISDADVATYDSDGFTLNWMTNDVTNMNQYQVDPADGDEEDAQVLYVAFGSESTTAVELSSFSAHPEDSAVVLEWETASELDNLGFHIHRATSEAGPYERITSSLIPGLGSSPTGARYSYRDAGLTNGVRYSYKLEDVETTGGTELHGPVSATPEVGAVVGPGECSGTDDGGCPGGGGRSGPAPSTRITHGDPSAVSLRVVRRGARGVELELLTGGFFATPEPDGSLRLEIPGFEVVGEPGTPAVPVERAFLEAVAGRQVRISAVVPEDVVAFSSLRPALAEAPELVVGRDGTVRAGHRRARAALHARGLYPAQAARVVSTAFQGEVKKALVELAPLRWDPVSGQLLLARRLRVQLAFAGRDEREIARGGSRGRLYRTPPRGAQGVVARLVARARGVYAVGFEQLSLHRGVPSSQLRLSRLGRDVAYHLEPDPSRFGPGSVLYFLSDGGSLSAYANEAVYELSLGATGTRMPVVSAPPSGIALAHASRHQPWEQNRYYLAGLLEAPDLWLWDSLLSGARKGYTLGLGGPAASSEPATLRVWLQGASDLAASPDHHVRVHLNGSLVTEASWDGKTPHRLEAQVSPGVLQQGPNLLELENVADTAAAYSMVYLDRLSLDYPCALAAEAGRFEARFGDAGSATLAGQSALSVVLDTTDTTADDPVSPRWITGAVASPDGLSLRVEAGRRYLVVSPEVLLQPEIRRPSRSDLRSTGNQADYLLVAPREFLSAATPLLQHREGQGLKTRAVALEEVFDVFGYGERSPKAVQDFLAYAYHLWSAPSPRYVLLLGDATLDPKDYAGTGVEDRVPAFMIKSSYLWTVSDQALAAVNGDDDLPDLALGRLPASSPEQARSLIEKLLAFEEAGLDLSGPAVLVADNADAAGNFERNADEIASSLLAGHATEKIYLSRLGASASRSAILGAFDRGASLVSYVGHGAASIWASENILNIYDMDKLGAQAEQPLLLTMNCLNGYFLPQAYDSLGEALVKAEGKGAIAAFTPSGMSLDAAAHLYHKALLGQILSDRHARLGDAILAAQSDYTATSAFPELLRIYNLLGDPAMSLR